MTFMTWEFKKIEVGEQGCSIKSHYEIGAKWFSLYRPSKFLSLKFFKLFYKFNREEAWLP
jgi:hypothetical protein